MDADQPVIDSRARRLESYLRHNGGRIVVDASLLLVWIFGATAIFNRLDQPTWLLYVVLFTGVVLYAQITPTWERPYESPD
ncbi:hypothetical protein [Halovivax gelatinilyticus]|uniref:hypothetical protein n=1 Tax=Halovivax gelatinilyticus TaxID=2961597 RepID=UPI0020CA51C4|nr:hypothetical protein [Halovivax gelatinilyticus]